MKMQKGVSIFGACFGLLLLAMSGCVPSQKQVLLPATSITAKANLIHTPTLTVQDQTPTALPTPSAAAGLVTMVPTLESDEAYAFVQKILRGSTGCQLPCWAGIVPGTTTNADAEMLLQLLSDFTDNVPLQPYKGQEFLATAGGRDFFFEGTDISFDFGWDSEKGNNIIRRLEIFPRAIKTIGNESQMMYGIEPYKQLFESYNLHGILSTLGIPSKVVTFAEVYNCCNNRPDPNPEMFYLSLIYDKGIFIEYKMPLKRIDGKHGKACPSDAFFDMWLVSADDSQFYQEMWSSNLTSSPDFSNTVPIEKSTQMTSDEFYRVFGASNSPCFQIPLNIWPEH